MQILFEASLFPLFIHYTTPINISIWGKVVVLCQLIPIRG